MTASLPSLAGISRGKNSSVAEQMPQGLVLQVKHTWRNAAVGDLQYELAAIRRAKPKVAIELRGQAVDGCRLNAIALGGDIARIIGGEGRADVVFHG